MAAIRGNLESKFLYNALRIKFISFTSITGVLKELFYSWRSYKAILLRLQHDRGIRRGYDNYTRLVTMDSIWLWLMQLFAIKLLVLFISHCIIYRLTWLKQQYRRLGLITPIFDPSENSSRVVIRVRKRYSPLAYFC